MHDRLPHICGGLRRVSPHAGLTNRVYRLEADKGAFFLRLPREETAGMIDRNAEAQNLKSAAEISVALPPLFCDPETGVLLTRAVDEVDCSPADMARQLGQALGQLHASGLTFSGRLEPDDVYRAQRHSLSISPRCRQEMLLLDSALEKMRTIPAFVSAKRLVPSHGDLSPGNCLVTAEKFWLIDWEYSGMSEPTWDLAYAVLEHGFSEEQEAELLNAYCASGAMDFRPSEEQLQIMKSKCDAVSAAWALEQLMKGRDEMTFLPFARARIERALHRLDSVERRRSSR
ncbi:choline/ethanolamine kinase family protein [Roseibium sp. SCP14]|uniref:choline/ethanolamine kinase family protein n=1 Tax=Roseibium sp. SCP14 TaxID=3141375 RepID=UPI00333C9C37